MKFRISKPALVAATRAAAGTATDRSVNGIYQSALIEAMPGAGLSFTATDLETTITTKAEAEIEESGRVCLPAAALAQLAAKLPETDIDVTVDNETDAATIKAGRGTFRLAGLRASDFPEVPSAGHGDAVTVDGARLALAIQRTVVAVARERQRYALNGICLKAAKDALEFWATDGRRMALDVVELPGIGEFFAIVGTNGVRQIARIAEAADNGGTVRLSCSRSMIFAATERESVATRLVEGTFPELRRVIPVAHTSRVTVSRAELMAALDRARLVDERDSYVVKLEAADGVLTLVAMSAEKATDEALACEHEGEAVKFGCAANFMLDALKSCAAETVTLGFGGADRQVVIAEGPQLHFVMPVTLA